MHWRTWRSWRYRQDRQYRHAKKNMRNVRILRFLTFLSADFNMPTSDIGKMKKKRERKRGTKVQRTGRR